jgi:CheY-like chemotaxis protein
MSASELFPIFVVEDSDDDLFLFRRLLTKAEIKHPLTIATNGQSAIDQLADLLAQGAALPRLVFLDLKLPLRSGFEVLEWIRAQPGLSTAVVLILSSSAEVRDVKRAYELGAHGYLVKYPAPAIFREIIATVSAVPAGAAPDLKNLPGVSRPT